jgi:hypothetical protein
VHLPCPSLCNTALTSSAIARYPLPLIVARVERARHYRGPPARTRRSPDLSRSLSQVFFHSEDDPIAQDAHRPPELTLRHLPRRLQLDYARKRAICYLVRPRMSCATCSNADTSLSCGHIFCKTCLGALSPSSCPLCRKPFGLDKVKRLIVDRPPSDSADVAAAHADGPQAEATQFLEQVAIVSNQQTSLEDAMKIIDGVKEWLAVQPNEPNTVSREIFCLHSCFIPPPRVPPSICTFYTAYTRFSSQPVVLLLTTCHLLSAPSSSGGYPVTSGLQDPTGRMCQGQARVQGPQTPLQEKATCCRA